MKKILLVITLIALIFACKKEDDKPSTTTSTNTAVQGCMDTIATNYNPEANEDDGTCEYAAVEGCMDPSGKLISSFELTLDGSFNGANALTDLVNNDLLIYIRKKNANGGTNFGYSAIPHSLHGANSFGVPVPYTDPPTATDGNGSACRTGSSAGNVITATFGSTNQCQNGFFVEVHNKNANTRIDSISCRCIHADGTVELNSCSFTTNELITTLVVIDKLDNTNNGVDMTLEVERIQ